MAGFISAEAFTSVGYDYVIIGGGTAGLTLANRLTENPQVTVALVEAGVNRIEDVQVLAPGLVTSQFGNDTYDWIFQTTPQVNINDRVIAQPQGKQLGGSSALNLLYWIRASQRDIDDWGELGNPGWSWQSLLPYFLKSESYIAPSDETATDLNTNSEFDPSVHGRSGPVVHGFPEEYGPFEEAWWKAYEGLGLGADGDPSAGRALGGFSTPLSVDPGTRTRSHAGVAYYKPAAARPNLKVLTNATVEKVLFDAFDPQGKLVAGGVMFRNQRQTRIVKARKEVILSAGAFGSPQILERSGIGSKTILDENKINIMYENENVGENLQDHVLALLGFEVADGQFTNEAFRNEEFFNDALAQYVANRDGPLSVAPCSTAFLSYEQLLANAQKGKVPQGLEDVLTSSEEQPALAKQIELTRDKLFDPIEATAQHLFITGGFTPALASNASAFFGTTSPGSYLTLAGILEHPFSRGTVHIKSSEPSDYPIINPNYLDAEVDLEVLADIMLNLQTIARTEPFASLLKDQGQVFQPGYTELTEENVREQIKITSVSQYHPIGTCAMSPRDKGGVVNERLIVHGTSNLRVVDASIFPLHVRANIQTLVYAVAEKAADMIKEDNT